MATPEFDEREHDAASRARAGSRAGGSRGREWDRRFGDAIVATAYPTCGIDMHGIARSDTAESVAAPPTTTSMIDSGSDGSR